MTLLEVSKAILAVWDDFDNSGPYPLDPLIEELRKAVAEAEKTDTSKIAR